MGGTAAGGHLENFCGAMPGFPADPGWVGDSTREDVQRMLWRWYANVAWPCGGGITRAQMFQVYKAWRESNYPGDSDDGWPFLSGAVNTIRPGCSSGFNALGVYHGGVRPGNRI